MHSLEDFLSIPTAPFRELFVLDSVKSILVKNKIPYFQDSTGNIIVGFGSATQYKKRLAKKNNHPLKLFIAHLDHPGFHGKKWISKKVLETEWHGGTPFAFLEGAAVWLSHQDSSEMIPGKIVNAELHAHGKSIKSAVIELDEEFSSIEARSFFGGFRFSKPVWKNGDLLYTKAADDLIGAYSILVTAIRLWKEKSHARFHFAGLLTRAEEVGFIGTLGHLREFYQKPRPSVLCVSLETSRTLPGAEIGKGPIIRQGDRTSIFDGGATHVFTKLAQSLLPGAYQKRIMDGGSCEGTAATVYGVKTIAISIPLGNYHNQGLEGGPESRGVNGPSPEFVHVNDIAGMQTLCYGLCTQKLNWANAWQDQRKDFQKLLKRYQPYVTKKENQKWVKSK